MQKNILVGLRAGTILATACLLAAACERSQSTTGTHQMGEAPPAAEHAVHDAQLRALMEKMARRSLVSWPQEIQAEYTGRNFLDAEDAESIQALARALRDAGKAIPDAVAHIDMVEADRRAFTSLVETLNEQSLALEQQAARGDLSACRQSLDAIADTCNACHVRFREWTGPLRKTGS